MIQALRGAIQVLEDDSDLIINAVGKMVNKLVEANSLNKNDIINIQFSITADLRSKNPAAALRHFGFADIPLFCSQEPDSAGMLPRTIRTMLLFNTDIKRSVHPIYLDGAEILRPDLFK